MKLITAQEIQNMNKNELAKFFDNLSRAQVQREADAMRWSRTVKNVDHKFDLYSEYSFD